MDPSSSWWSFRHAGCSRDAGCQPADAGCERADAGAGSSAEKPRSGLRRAAVADVGLLGVAEVGDEVIVNVEALDLGLGSGGFDIVHVNLSRGLGGGGPG